MTYDEKTSAAARTLASLFLAAVSGLIVHAFDGPSWAVASTTLVVYFVVVAERPSDRGRGVGRRP